MEDNIISNLQKYLEYIRYNTMDFGLRLLKDFTVCQYTFSNQKYQAIFEKDNFQDSYYVSKIDLEKFLGGKFSNKINLFFEKPFKDKDKNGFYLSLQKNKLDPNMDNIKKLFGLRFKKNDIFYKIVDVSFQQINSKQEEINSIILSSNVKVQDNVKIFIVEDFGVNDFLEVNQFAGSGKTVKKGMGYSIEIDELESEQYVTIQDARTAIKMTKETAMKEILVDLSSLFPNGHKLGDYVKQIVKKRLI